MGISLTPKRPNPAAGALRELEEEVGLSADHLDGFSLRYVALRDTGSELRHNYYFFARLRDEVPGPTYCSEGQLQWFNIEDDLGSLVMPPTARAALSHWVSHGRHDEQVRFIGVQENGTQIGPV